MRRTLLSVFAISLCLLFCPLCPAVGNGLALDFSSDMVSTSHGQKQTSRIYMQGTKMRMESGQQPGYTIMRPDKNVVWMVMPEQKSYMEMRFDPSKQPRSGEKVQGEVSRKLLGTETVDGHPCRKYEVTYKDKETSQKMYQWMATDINFPVKTAAIDGAWMVEYRNIKLAAQPGSLFEVPAGFRKTSMNLPGMGVGAGPGQSRPTAEQDETVQAPAEESAEGSGGIMKKLPKLGIPKLPSW
jgi:hypothetical protein